jgi:hypothetical protein
VNFLGFKLSLRELGLGCGDGTTDVANNFMRMSLARSRISRSTFILTALEHALAVKLASCNVFRYFLDNLFSDPAPKALHKVLAI